MILELTFCLGLCAGLVAGLILFYIFFKEDDFSKRQKRYRRMIWMAIDLDYYINVYDLMRLDLPRPALKVQRNFVEDGVEVPIVLGGFLEW